MRIFVKINIWQIVRSHLKTLRNHNTGKLGIDDYITFFILPFLGSSLLLFFSIKLNESAISIIITTLSILVGLLFNVIVIIFDIIKRDNTKKVKNEILHQLLTNISYGILISILIIVLTLITYFSNCYVNLISTWFVYFLLGNFFMTILMILKRMYLLFLNELDEIENNQK
jgi:energy-coupling factor transporter transmembrane protein EcfT